MINYFFPYTDYACQPREREDEFINFYCKTSRL